MLGEYSVCWKGEKLWNHQRGATWSVEVSLPLQGVGTGWTLSSFPTQSIPRLHDGIVTANSPKCWVLDEPTRSRNGAGDFSSLQEAEISLQGWNLQKGVLPDVLKARGFLTFQTKGNLNKKTMGRAGCRIFGEPLITPSSTNRSHWRNPSVEDKNNLTEVRNKCQHALKYLFFPKIFFFSLQLQTTEGGVGEEGKIKQIKFPSLRRSVFQNIPLDFFLIRP